MADPTKSDGRGETSDTAAHNDEVDWEERAFPFWLQTFGSVDMSI